MLVITALMMTVLLGVSALVVDVGYGRVKEREVANSADAAALGGAQDLASNSAAGTANTVAAAESIAALNLPSGSFPWNTCTDDAEALSSPWPGASCISFDSSFTYIRVHIPQQTFGTFFGKALGVSTLSTTATATARVVGAGFASIEPFAIYSGFSGIEACLKQGPSGHKTSILCSDPETGNFNMLDVRQYGNETLGTPQRCGNLLDNKRLIDNITIGADHMFSTWPVGSAGVVDECSGAPNPNPNMLEVRTGNDLSGFDSGMVHTSSSTGAVRRQPRGCDAGAIRRPRSPACSSTTSRCTSSSRRARCPTSPPAASGRRSTPCSPRPARVAAGRRGRGARHVLRRLRRRTRARRRGLHRRGVLGRHRPLRAATTKARSTCTTSSSPRASATCPSTRNRPPSGSSSLVHIASFRAVFIDMLEAGCSATSCDVSFEPGPWNISPFGATNDTAQSITAYVFTASMLPGRLGSDPDAIGQNHYVQLVK